MSKQPSEHSEPIILSVVMAAAPGREEELARELQALLAPTRAEAGCLTYLLHGDMDKSGRYLFYEMFRDQDALDSHVNSAHFQHFLAYRAQGTDPVAVQTVTKWRSIS
jgi:quinol monooxygenase YgiN